MMRRGRPILGIRWIIAAVVAALAACASGPPVPDWKSNAKSAIDATVTAALDGDAATEARDFDRARSEVARTGRPDLMARIVLMRCAAHVASLDFGACEGFADWRTDATAQERAYADYLAARTLPASSIELLPAAQRRAAAALGGGAVPQAKDIEDPLSRLIAVAVLFKAGKADPALIDAAVATASDQGWRRPLLAWLEVQAMRAQKAGDAAAEKEFRRRMDIVGMTPAPAR